MQTVQTTIRLDRALKENLERLGRMRAMTLNKLVTVALEQFVVRDALTLQRELRQSLALLEQIAADDPGFEKAIAETAAAEAAIVEDPVEGEAYLAEGTATGAVRDILGG